VCGQLILLEGFDKRGEGKGVVEMVLGCFNLVWERKGVGELCVDSKLC